MSDHLKSAALPGFICLLLASSCTLDRNEPETRGSDEITSLPFERLSLDNLSAFNEPPENWRVAGSVQSDYNTRYSMELSEGSGVVVQSGTDERGGHLFTNFEHEDIELKVEVLVPGGSSSGIFLQGRYEVQINDSWRVEQPKHSDAGGVYEWGEASISDEERGHEGSAPFVNASLAPGLWQEYHILFRAPRFDEDGNKTENARFEWVWLNGVLVQEDLEVGGPTRAAPFEEEAPLGPLMFQGDQGPVAFRNIRYKKYNRTDSISLGEFSFTIYDYEGDRTPKHIDNLPVIAEGVTNHFNVWELSPRSEYYASLLSGEFEVPVTGDYLFETQINNGGHLYINGELILENHGDVENRQIGAIIHLPEGTHQLDVTHFQLIWESSISIRYEGPGMEKSSLAGNWSGRGGGRIPNPVTIQEFPDGPKRIGGFFDYQEEKRTHVLSVGHPDGIHYSYDLQNFEWLSFWRDPFADVTRMWRGRGYEQLLVPMNAAVASGSGVPLVSIGRFSTGNTDWPGMEGGVNRYQIDESGLPVFITEVDGVTIEDHLSPDETGKVWIRALTYRSSGTRSRAAARLAGGVSIEKLFNGLYRVDGSYYIRVLTADGEEPEIVVNGEHTALLIPVLRNSNRSEIRYQVIW
ncbi:MAG: family 16 glycoside hydrolase [Balneolaceae bacterium]